MYEQWIKVAVLKALKVQWWEIGFGIIYFIIKACIIEVQITERPVES